MDNFGKSCQRIMDVLSSSASTQQDIVNATGLSERTVKYLLKSLVSKNIVSVQHTFSDMRRKTYTRRDSNLVAEKFPFARWE